MSYERLTSRNDFQGQCSHCKYIPALDEYGCWNDTEKRFMLCNKCEHKDRYDKLKKLEDKIEDGTLKDLPCKVGDTMYILSDPFFTACIEPVIILKIEIVGLNRIQVYATGEETHEYYECVPSEYIFKRKLEAEEKLRELRGEK